MGARSASEGGRGFLAGASGSLFLRGALFLLFLFFHLDWLFQFQSAKNMDFVKVLVALVFLELPEGGQTDAVSIQEKWALFRGIQEAFDFHGQQAEVISQNLVVRLGGHVIASEDHQAVAVANELGQLISEISGQDFRWFL